MNEETFLKLQMQMQNNNTEYKDFLDGLDSWKDDIKNKDGVFLKDLKEQNNIPIRNALFKKTKVSKNVSIEKRSKIKAYDYRAWDKFDADKAIEEAESNEKSYIEVEVDEKVKRENLIKEYKDVGNLRFKEGKYEAAVKEYTNGIVIDSKNSFLYNNRAIALMKLENFEAALDDCNQCIFLDAGNVKAYYRRAQCYRQLNNEQSAIDDVRSVLHLDSCNKAALQLLEQLNPRGIVKPIFHLSPTENYENLYRVNIIDVNPVADEDNRNINKTLQFPLNSMVINKANEEISSQSYDTKIKKSNTENKILQEVARVSESPEVAHVSALRESLNTPTHAPNASSSTTKHLPIPRNSVQLIKQLRCKLNKHELANYICSIPSHQYRCVIGQSLDSSILSSFIQGLLFGSLSPEQLVMRLNDLSRVPRFNSSFMMMTSDQLDLLRSTVKHFHESTIKMLSFDIFQ